MPERANERVGPIEGSIGAEADSLRRKLAAAEARCSELEGRLREAEQRRLHREVEAMRLASQRDALGEALSVAADDLDKAANQFAGLLPEGVNKDRFAEKAERARRALAPGETTGEDEPDRCVFCGEEGEFEDGLRCKKCQEEQDA